MTMRTLILLTLLAAPLATQQAPPAEDVRIHEMVGDVTQVTLEGLIIDNYFFGVVAVAADGNESVVVFPRRAARGETC
jgi:hypothetical protein